MLSAVDVIDFLSANDVLPGSLRSLTKMEFFALVLKAKERSDLLSKFIRETFACLPPQYKYVFSIDTWDELSNCYYCFAAGHQKRTLPN